MIYMIHDCTFNFACFMMLYGTVDDISVINRCIGGCRNLLTVGRPVHLQIGFFNVPGHAQTRSQSFYDLHDCK